LADDLTFKSWSHFTQNVMIWDVWKRVLLDVSIPFTIRTFGLQTFFKKTRVLKMLKAQNLRLIYWEIFSRKFHADITCWCLDLGPSARAPSQTTNKD
jgi:hypothetical protein